MLILINQVISNQGKRLNLIYMKIVILKTMKKVLIITGKMTKIMIYWCQIYNHLSYNPVEILMVNSTKIVLLQVLKSLFWRKKVLSCKKNLIKMKLI